jgi:hypothetical protein
MKEDHLPEWEFFPLHDSLYTGILYEVEESGQSHGRISGHIHLT